MNQKEFSLEYLIGSKPYQVKHFKYSKEALSRHNIRNLISKKLGFQYNERTSTTNNDIKDKMYSAIFDV